MDDFTSQTHRTRDRRPWQVPAVKAVGTIGEILQGGGGKASVTPADPGETRKPTGAMG